MKPITVNNNTYNSIAQAWREVSPEGLSQIQVRMRLYAGWSNEDAFLLPTVPPKQRRKFPEVRNK